VICADFSQSNLTRADFRNSDLENALFQNANLTGTSFDARPKAPEKGSFVGWKRVYDKQGNSVIAELLIPEDAKRVTPLFGRMCRAEFVKVLELSPNISFAKCKFYPDRVYRVGEIVHAGFYDDNVQIGCTLFGGIHFFLTREEAEQHSVPSLLVPGTENWQPPTVYWKGAIYRGWVNGIKYLNQPDNKEGRWQTGKLFNASTAKLLNQWDKEDKEEKLQKRSDHQTSLASCAPIAHCTPINPMGRALGFYLDDTGHSVVPANSVSPLTIENHSQEYALSWEKGRVLQDFQVVYISKGKGVFQSTQSGLIPINAGDAFLLFPGEWHRYRPDPEVGWTEYWISFSGNYASKLMVEPPFSPLKPVIRVGHDDALLQLFSTLTKRMHNNPFFNPLVAATQGIQILAHLATTKQKQRYRSEHSEKIEIALSYVSEHAEQFIDFKALAWDLKLNYTAFRREFHKVAGMPHTQYQIEIRLNKAKELLCETTLPIGEIAEQLGFESPYYFSRFFNKKIGMTAREYRQTSSGGSIRRWRTDLEITEAGSKK